MRILLVRTDNIGDVVLSIPMAGIIKKYLPKSEVLFLGKTYTGPVIHLSKNIDGFFDWNAWENLPDREIVAKLKSLELDVIIFVFPHTRLAKLSFYSKIPMRVGTSRRWYHWLYLNKRISFSRHKSDLHESQLNIQLLRALQIPIEENLHQLSSFYGVQPPLTKASPFIQKDKFNLILHPLSFGSAMEWGQDQFVQLIEKIDHDKFNVIVTGTSKEAELLKEKILLPCQKLITDATGKLSLEEFIHLIASADGLIAASTGPLHLASMLGIHALGLYSCRRPIHPGRWAPLGIKAQYLVTKEDTAPLSTISVQEVLENLKKWSV